MITPGNDLLIHPLWVEAKLVRRSDFGRLRFMTFSRYGVPADAFDWVLLAHWPVVYGPEWTMTWVRADGVPGGDEQSGPLSTPAPGWADVADLSEHTQAWRLIGGAVAGAVALLLILTLAIRRWRRSTTRWSPAAGAS